MDKPWSEMTDRERDALIAEKVMGYTLDWEFSDLVFDGAPCVRELRTQDDEWGILPNYTTSESDAFTLVHRHPHYFSLVRSNDTGSGLAPWGEVTWRCRFYAPEKFEAKAPTAAFAICLAALKANEVAV